MIEFTRDMALGFLGSVFAGNLWLSFRMNQAKWPYRSNHQEISRLLKVDIIPRDSTFAIWGVIYLWQLAWICYAIYATAIGHGTWSTTEVYICYASLILIQVGWSFLYDRQRLFPCALLLIGMAALGWYTTLIAYDHFVRRGFQDSWEKQLNAGLLINGLACHAAWLTVATVLVNCQHMVVNTRISNSLICKGGLVVLACFISGYEYMFQVHTPALSKVIWCPPFVFWWAALGMFARQEFKLNTLLRLMVGIIFLATSISAGMRVYSLLK